MDQYVEMKDLAQQGLSVAEIARRLGMERHTVTKYMRSGPPQAQTRNRRSCLEPFHAHLEQRLSQGCTNGVVLLREIQAMGYEGGYTILKEFLSPRRQDERRRVELRWESAPGQYAQVDWGHFRAQFPDSSAIKLYAFVFTLAYSRATYAEWTTSMDLATLEHCHQRAFEYIGGIPKCLVYDRMKTVVLGDDDRGHARIHPAFLDFAGHYGFVPRPAPPRWPRGKGKVESGVKYVRRNFWQGLVTISGVDDLNRRCREWLDGVANVRTHGTTGRAPFEMLKDEDLAPIAGLPAYPVHLAVQRLVSRDCLVSYGGCRYSVPAEWAGKSVWVRLVRDDRVVVTAGGQVISEHPLEPVLRRTVIDDAHYDALRGRPRYREMKVVPRIETPPLEVERRSLAEYQAIAEAVR